MLRQRWQTPLLPLLLLGLAGCQRLPTVTGADPGVAVRVEAEPPQAKKVEAPPSKQSDAPPSKKVEALVKNADAPENKKVEEPASDKEGFRFPDDKGGALLARVLPPALERATVTDKATPRRLPPPASVESPTVPLAPVVASLPRALLTPKRPALAPRFVAEETLDGAAMPVVPQAQTFPTGDRTRTDSVDVNQPIGLPVLAQPVPDRASLEDPTTETSALAATSAPAPQRANPVPFQRISIPDPFENRAPVQLKEIPAEETTPPLGTPRTPGK